MNNVIQLAFFIMIKYDGIIVETLLLIGIYTNTSHFKTLSMVSCVWRAGLCHLSLWFPPQASLGDGDGRDRQTASLWKALLQKTKEKKNILTVDVSSTYLVALSVAFADGVPGLKPMQWNS